MPFLAAMALAATVSSSSDARIETLIDSMSPRERLTQLLFVGFSGTRVNDDIKRLATDWRVGAIAVYSRNVSSPEQLRVLTSQIRALYGNRVPPLIAVDQEGGVVARIDDGVPQLPGQMALGATRSTELATRAGRTLGASLRGLGIDMNLAPVLDLAQNPRSPIGIRSFAADPELVARLGAAFIRGQRESGVVSAAKHFPGIGATATDSHDAMPAIDLARANLIPFRAAAAAGVAALMVAHVAVPSVDGNTPATLSPGIIRLARDELRFEGIIITDAIEMQALDKSEGIGRLAVRSIVAGADLVMVLWHGRDREEAIAALEAAAKSGELSEARIRESLRRILRVKLGLRGTPDRRAVSPTIADDIAAASITLLRNRGDLIPLKRRDGVVYVGPPGPIADAVKSKRSVLLPTYIPAEGIALWSGKATAAVQGATAIVGVAQNDGQLAAIRAAHEANRDAAVVLVSLGSPQMIASLPDASAYVCAYGYLPPSQRAVAAVLTGRLPARGTLPVAIPGFFAAP
jgi:beta-N-acetylhexosaminidase